MPHDTEKTLRPLFSFLEMFKRGWEGYVELPHHQCRLNKF